MNREQTQERSGGVGSRTSSLPRFSSCVRDIQQTPEPAYETSYKCPPGGDRHLARTD